MKLFKSKTLSISIDCEPEKIYKFVSNLENMPKWAKTFCLSVKKTDGNWVIETPQGQVGVRLVKENEFGILDHYVSPSAGVKIFVPLRVVSNGPGSEVVFTIFQQPGMSNESFKNDIALVKKDLKSLKSIMENNSYL